MSAYRGHVGQRAVEALMWCHCHHDIIVTSSVISVVIGAPTLGESSGVCQSVLRALRDSVRYPHNVSVEDARHNRDTR